jgi:hypothetical protein
MYIKAGARICVMKWFPPRQPSSTRYDSLEDCRRFVAKNPGRVPSMLDEEREKAADSVDVGFPTSIVSRRPS